MRMTEAQIAEKYLRATDKKEAIKNLAEINDCMPSEIKEILENQDVTKLAEEKPKKRGRKPMTEEQKLQKKQEKEAAEQRAQAIPEAVKVVIEERIEVLKASIEAHITMIDKNRTEIEELKKYLNGN